MKWDRKERVGTTYIPRLVTIPLIVLPCTRHHVVNIGSAIDTMDQKYRVW